MNNLHCCYYMKDKTFFVFICLNGKTYMFLKSDLMFVGLAAVCSCFLIGVTAGKLTDLAFGYVKETIIVLLILSAFFYYWFLLLYTKTVSFAKCK